MTRDRELKRQIRRRMALTGERYTVARSAVVPEPAAVSTPGVGSADTARGGTSTMRTNTFVTVQFVTDDPTERAAAARLEEVLERWPLDRFVYFECVRLDADASELTSFPVPTFGPAMFDDDLSIALATFLHAQMHWACNEVDGARAAIDSLRERWPELASRPDVRPCATSDEATHVVVGWLQRAALAEALGGARHGDAAFAAMPGNERVAAHLADPAVAAHLDSLGLVIPESPPNARRASERVDLGPSGPLVTLEMGEHNEVRFLERLRDLHDRFDLRPWRFSPQVRIQSVGPPKVDGAVPSLSTYFLFSPDVDVAMNYVQLQAGWWARRHPASSLEGPLASVIQEAGLADDPTPRDVLLAVTFACAVALDAARRLFGEAEAAEAVERHPRNGAIYRALTPRLASVLAALQQEEVDVVAP